MIPNIFQLEDPDNYDQFSPVLPIAREFIAEIARRYPGSPVRPSDTGIEFYTSLAAHYADKYPEDYLVFITAQRLRGEI